MATVVTARPKHYPPLRLSPEEIAWLVNRVDKGNTRYPKLNSRFEEDHKAEAVAIIMAESGGNVYALNDKFPPIEAYGLAQIRADGQFWTERSQMYGLSNKEELYQADLNVAIMAQMSTSGNNWKPWEVYTTKAYLAHMPRAREAMKKPQDPSGRLKTPEQAAEGASTWDRLVEFIQTGMLRVAGFVGGGVLLVLAIVLYVRRGGKL